ncbi:MAG: septum site-determining protein MinC [Gammaproteobacteria bacterium]|nr:septum site-determining protein MinC [Gammaproteobacteria bacterium]
MSKTDGQCFQLKADFFPMTVLKISNSNPENIGKQLEQTIAKAPNYFTRAPVVVDVDSIDRKQSFDLEAICNSLREHKIIPVGVRGLRDDELGQAADYGLAILKSNGKELSEKKSETASPSNEAPSAANKIITKPIRAGSQVYAKDGDLIILSGVNHGAECIADGNIHIYGPLRGRALAGARGNPRARIFCKSLEAELISIAGHYVVSEDLQVPETDAPMLQIFLKDDALHIEGL